MSSDNKPQVIVCIKPGIKRKTWTQEEDDIIRSSISECPQNLCAAFECAAQVIGNGRTPLAISQRWYSFLKHSKPVMATGSEKGIVLPNGKVIHRLSYIDKKGVDLSDVMRDVIELPKKDIEVLRKYLNAMQKFS